VLVSPSPTASSAPLEGISTLPTLGVGVLYNPALTDFLHSDLEALDYVEVIPDMGQTDRGPGQSPRYTELEAWLELMDWLSARRPLIAHNIGLSIGSADVFEPEYVAQMAHWQQRYGFTWHSDHLSFAQLGGVEGHSHNVGLALPVPYDEPVLRMIAGRVEIVQRALGVPFLLENNVYYVDLPDQEMTEPEFLNRLTARTGCGLLLDVHNVYTNARNHGFDALGFVDAIDLARVVEVHIAGGNELAGMYTDSHAGPCPPEVWTLLAHVAARAPNLRAVTFEFHESYFPLLGGFGLRKQIDRARETLAMFR
jgi:uncharacterized protein (UPF0276 family)